MNTERQSGSLGTTLTESMDQMIRLPLKMTEGTVDMMMDSMRWMTNGMTRLGGTGNADISSCESKSSSTDSGSGRYYSASRSRSTSSGSGTTWLSRLTGSQTDDQDLSGDDLKYVVWSIVFTKPGFECVLERQHEDIVAYDADPNSFAAVKIAKFLENARNGRVEKPEGWHDRGYPGTDASANGARRTDSNAFGAQNPQSSTEKAWRVPAEDQRYITFLYRVERRLPKQEEEVTRVERVTVARGRSTNTAIA